jgi:hypothetical protein
MRLEEALAGMVDATNTNASKNPRRSLRIGPQACRFQSILLLLLARVAKPAATS